MLDKVARHTEVRYLTVGIDVPPRVKKLRSLGISHDNAYVANNRRGPWHNAGLPQLKQALSPGYFRKQGLFSLIEAFDRLRITSTYEPPCYGPVAGGVRARGGRPPRLLDSPEIINLRIAFHIIKRYIVPMRSLLKKIQELVAHGNVRISDHGYDELAEDGILARDVVAALPDGETLEDYPDFSKGPCVLVLLSDGSGRPLHAVWGIPKAAVLVTAYRPDPNRWTDDFRRRT